MVAAVRSNPQQAFDHFKAKFGFDIPAQSNKTLNLIKTHLRSGTSYLASCRVQPQFLDPSAIKIDRYVFEEGHFLTGEEHSLFSFLVNHFSLKHTTPDLAKIGTTLKSLKSREESGEDVFNRNTHQGTDLDNWVFLTMGIGDHQTPYLSEKRSEILVDFRKASNHETNPLRECWVGTHLDDFGHGISYGRVRVGGTDFAITMTDKPRTKTYEYKRADGTIFRREVTFQDEILYGNDIPRGIAYQFILHLRFMGGDYRQEMFRFVNDPSIPEERKVRKLSTFMNVVMPGGSYPEVKVFGQLPLLPDYTTFKTHALIPEDTRLFECLNNDRFDELRDRIAEAKNLNIPNDRSDFPLSILLWKANSFKNRSVWTNAVLQMLNKGALINISSYYSIPLYERLFHSDELDWFLSLEQPHPDDPEIAYKATLVTRRSVHPLLAYLNLGRTSALSEEQFEVLRKHSIQVKQHDAALLTFAVAYGSLLTNVFAMGVDPNAKGEQGYTPLMCAVVNEREEAVRGLAKAGTDLNVQLVTPVSTEEEGYTALHLAVSKQKNNIVQLLLSLGAATDICSAGGQTPLGLAVGTPMEDLLLNSGATHYSTAKYKEIHRGVAVRITGTNAAGQNCVLVGRKRNREGHWDTKLYFPGGFQAFQEDPVQALIREVKEETLIDLTPHLSKISLLCDYHRPNITNEKLYTTRIYAVNLGPLMAETPFFAEDDIAALYLMPLDQLKVDPKAPFLTRYSLSGLPIAASNGIALSDKCVESDHLYKALHLELQGEERLCHLASIHGTVKQVESLIKKGVSIECASQPKTPLESSAAAGNNEVVTLLKAKGAAFRKKDSYYERMNFPALDFAAENGHTQTVELLCEGIQLKLEEIYSATKKAACFGHANCLQWLMKHQKLPVKYLPDILAEALRNAINRENGVMEILISPLNKRFRRIAYTQILAAICSEDILDEIDLNFVQFLLDQGASVFYRGDRTSAIQNAFSSLQRGKPKTLALISLLLKSKERSPAANNYFNKNHEIYSYESGVCDIVWNDGRFNLDLKTHVWCKNRDLELNFFEYHKLLRAHQLPSVCKAQLKFRIKQIVGKQPNDLVISGEGDSKTIEVTFEDKIDQETLDKVSNATLQGDASSLKLDKEHYINLYENKDQAAEMWGYINP